MIEPTKKDLFREVMVASAEGVLVGFSGPVVMVLLDGGQWPTSVNKNSATLEWKVTPKIERKRR